MLGQIVATWLPNVWQAFLDFRLHSTTLSSRDVNLLEALLMPLPESMKNEEAIALRRSTAASIASLFGWLERRPDGSLKPHSERARFEAFCARLDISVPWK